MSKILLSFFNGIMRPGHPEEMPPFYEAFISGLVAAGNDVLVYSNKKFSECDGLDDKCREELLRFAPDLIISFNNNGADWANLFECPIFVYEVDSAVYYSNKDAVKRCPSRYTYFVLQKQSSEFLQHEYGVPAECIRYTHPFTEIHAERLPKIHNVCFLGSRFNCPGDYPWLRFQRSRPSESALQAYAKMLQRVNANPFMPVEEYDEICSQGGLPNVPMSDIVMALSSAKRLRVLGQVSDLGLDLYGGADWLASGENDELIMAFRQKTFTSLKQNQDLYNASKVCLNVNHVQAIGSFSWRVLDIMASDGCLLGERNGGFVETFHAIDVPVFENWWEVRQKCKYLLDNPSYREEVVCACNAEVDAHWRFSEILEILQEGTNIPLKCSGDGHLAYCMPSPEREKPGIKTYIKHHARVRRFLGGTALACAQVPFIGKLFREQQAMQLIR